VIIKNKRKINMSEKPITDKQPFLVERGSGRIETWHETGKVNSIGKRELRGQFEETINEETGFPEKWVKSEDLELEKQSELAERLASTLGQGAVQNFVEGPIDSIPKDILESSSKVEEVEAPRRTAEEAYHELIEGLDLAAVNTLRGYAGAVRNKKLSQKSGDGEASMAAGSEMGRYQRILEANFPEAAAIRSRFAELYEVLGL
jgi:hypothetical protein